MTASVHKTDPSKVDYYPGPSGAAHARRHKIYDNLTQDKKDEQDWALHGGPLRSNSRLFAKPVPIMASDLDEQEEYAYLEYDEDDAIETESKKVENKPQTPRSSISSRSIELAPSPLSSRSNSNQSRKKISKRVGRQVVHPIHPTNLDRANLSYRTKYLPDGRMYISTDIQDSFCPGHATLEGKTCLARFNKSRHIHLTTDGSKSARARTSTIPCQRRNPRAYKWGTVPKNMQAASNTTRLFAGLV